MLLCQSHCDSNTEKLDFLFPLPDSLKNILWQITPLKMCFGSYLTPGNHLTVLWCLFGVFALFGGCRNGLCEILTEIQRFLWLLHMLGLIFLTPCYNRLDAIASLLPPVLGAWMLNQLNTSKTWYNSQYYSHCMAAAISFLTELYYMCILNFIFAILFWGMSDQCKHVYDCMFC